MGAGRRRTNDQILRDRATISRLYLTGLKQAEIADQLGVTQQQISYDLSRIRDDWMESTRGNYEQYKSERLAYLEILEREAWDAWERSKKTKKIRQGHNKKTLTGERDETVTMERHEDQVGDPRYLAELRTLAHDKSELLGLITNKPTILIQMGISEPLLRQLGEVAELYETTPAEVLGWLVAEARREDRESSEYLLPPST